MKKLFLVISILSAFIFTKAIAEEIVTLETTQGIVKIKLWPEIAPKACENFLKLVEQKYYDGIIFHRIIKNFMVQTGDPTGTGAGGKSIWNKNFEDEVKLGVSFNKAGLVAMANAGPNTNGSQFFITTKMTPWLNMKHTIFGEVIEGYENIKKLENLKTDFRDKPEIEQKIVRAYTKSEDNL
ncbi:MAG: putative peptidyl-prolyl cis-trans isomerase [Candidatus Anoxychlamydiales bacterium]|nr:putative peptidyl-prolyl cis-trans isomerase [Candidatus Anoxychlamydiales bacterium]